MTGPGLCPVASSRTTRGAKEAAIRELAEETSVPVSGEALTLLYKGHVYDPRQRLDRWIEDHLYVYWTDTRPEAVAGDDAKDVAWSLITAEALENVELYADHAFLLSQVRMHIGKQEPAVERSFERFPAGPENTRGRSTRGRWARDGVPEVRVDCEGMSMGRKTKKTKLDIHLHTPTSDGVGKPRDYVKAIQKSGLDGVCITDHHVSGGTESKAIAKAIRDAGFLCFMGCEYSTNDGHLLIFGVDVAELKLGKYPPMQDVIWKVRERGGVAIPSHPFFGWRKKLGSKIFKMQDLVAVEGFNGQLSVKTPYNNEEAQKAAEALQLPIIGTSDAHKAERIGTCYTEFDGAIRRPADFIRALLSGEFRPVENRRRVAQQKRQAHTWWSSHNTRFAGSSSGRYSSGSGDRQDPYQDVDWDAYDRLQEQREQLALWEQEQDWIAEQEEADRLALENQGLPDEAIPNHAFSDPFFASEDPGEVRGAIAALEHWHEQEEKRARQRKLRPTKKRGFFV